MIKFIKDHLGLNRYQIERYERKRGWHPIGFNSFSWGYANAYIRRLRAGLPNELYRIEPFDPHWLEKAWEVYDREQERIRD